MGLPAVLLVLHRRHKKRPGAVQSKAAGAF
jgi:hypothetical protein